MAEADGANAQRRDGVTDGWFAVNARDAAWVTTPLDGLLSFSCAAVHTPRR